jgi:hypothetical protein
MPTDRGENSQAARVSAEHAPEVPVTGPLSLVNSAGQRWEWDST